MRRRTLLSSASGGGDGHEFVTIGGVKWATMNIGADTETDYGLYFQWGDTAGYTSGQVGSNSTAYKKPFYRSDYKFNDGRTTWSATGMTKYNASDNKIVLDPSDDAARLHWGGNWRMPTIEEYQELTANTTSTWETNYNGTGARGRLFTSKTDPNAKLFFPAASYCENGTFSMIGSYGDYWSSSLDTANKLRGRYQAFSSSNVYDGDYRNRYIGRTVRAVLDL